MPEPKPSGIVYLGRPIEELPREELIDLVVGMDFTIGRLCERNGGSADPLRECEERTPRLPHYTTLWGFP